MAFSLPSGNVDGSNPSEPFVRCVGLSKYFGGVRALYRVSVELYPGEIMALVGDNGAGKSTLVKILSGIYQPEEGEIWVEDRRFTRMNPRGARLMGIETVYQHLSLCENLGAAKNVVLGREPVRFSLGPLRFIDHKRSVATAQEQMSQVGIALENLNSPVRRLSGGERQAVAIARATFKGSRLIMFDEPCAALGVRQTRAALQLIRQVASQSVAVIVISHNLDDVFAVADRIVALRLGEITLDTPLASTSREEVVSCMTGMSLQNNQ